MWQSCSIELILISFGCCTKQSVTHKLKLKPLFMFGEHLCFFAIVLKSEHVILREIFWLMSKHAHLPI